MIIQFHKIAKTFFSPLTKNAESKSTGGAINDIENLKTRSIEHESSCRQEKEVVMIFSWKQIQCSAEFVLSTRSMVSNYLI